MILNKLALQVVHSFVVNRATASAVLAAIVIIGGSGAVLALHSTAKQADSQTRSASTQSTPNTTPTPTVTASPLPASAEVILTPDVATSAVVPTPSAAQTTIPSTPTPSVSQSPTTPAHVVPSITISNDGCRVIAIGDAGLIFVTGSYKPGHHGGQSAYMMPSSQSLTENVGGPKGDKVFGELIDASGAVVAQATALITSDTCTPGNPSTVDGFYPMPADA